MAGSDEVFLTYEKDGIKVTLTEEVVAFHKNGLKIEMPFEFLYEFVNELEKGVAELNEELVAQIKLHIMEHHRE